jgi:hypothetical protein
MEKLISFNDMQKMKKIHTNSFSLPQYSTRIKGLPPLLKTLNFEREVLDIRLNLGIVELATNKTFCIENTGEQDGWKNVRVVGVHRNHSDLVLCGVAGQTFVIREGDIGRPRSCAIFLVVCNDFYTIILPHTHATKRYLSSTKG